MIGIVVTGHGNFATGLTSSVKLIAGMPEKYVAVDFVQEDSTDDLTSHLKAAFEQLAGCEGGILVFTDLMGGSPFKMSVELSVALKDKYKIRVVTGTNLGMLIEANMSRGFMEDVDSLADMAIETGKQQLMKYVYTEHTAADEASDSDGI
ncbi:MAG: PTS fructose transporter subunit IIA [Solobacterium sp.]|jgi:PTS system N-acetylgalactosamine-specific IIA component|nr:PTS fructose transporter subunit IIA [Solobacterium sp.]MCH4221825.1 PTS fructose transporter subunit IIA [Solobacterium sp.]MCH4265047.1 PTS fructose transporter subunit IIA [Solobacterium sp.]